VRKYLHLLEGREAGEGLDRFESILEKNKIEKKNFNSIEKK
jgi:hypothetical protein